MRAVDRLKRDHEILRSKLDVLEGALGMGPETWYVLREVCFTLSRQLRDHIKREEALVAACRSALNPTMLAEIVVAHRDEPAHLATINRLFVSQTAQSVDRITPGLLEVIHGLRRHMASEEQELFPILERALAEQEPEGIAESSPLPWLDETMTVNRVVQVCPSTRTVFEQLFINLAIEGCSSLDEVAWRHGMESRELLEALEAFRASCECPSHEPSRSAQAIPEASGAMRERVT